MNVPNLELPTNMKPSQLLPELHVGPGMVHDLDHRSTVPSLLPVR